MDIKLEDINQTKFGEYFLADRKRLATATGVKLINNTHLFTASFVGCRLYFIYFDYDKKESVVLDSIDTTLDNELVCPDLLDYTELNGCATIALSILEQNAVLIYELKDNKLCKKSQIKIPRKGKCHGICFHPVNKNIVLATSNYYNFFVCHIDLEKNEVIDYVDFPFKVQDARFFNEKIFLVGVNSSPNSKISRLFKFKKMISYLSIDGKVHEFKNTRLDGLGIINNKIYVADQYNDCVFVINFSGKVESIIEDMSFPHGVDVNEDFLAVTNYGTNTIKVVKIS